MAPSIKGCSIAARTAPGVLAALQAPADGGDAGVAHADINRAAVERPSKRIDMDIYRLLERATREF